MSWAVVVIESCCNHFVAVVTTFDNYQEASDAASALTQSLDPHEEAIVAEVGGRGESSH